MWTLPVPPRQPPETTVVPSVPQSKTGSSPTYSLAQLQGSMTLPGVDREHREQYLSDEEFLKAFGVDKKTWATMPMWKKSNKKKALGLF